MFHYKIVHNYTSGWDKLLKVAKVDANTSKRFNKNTDVK